MASNVNDEKASLLSVIAAQRPPFDGLCQALWGPGVPLEDVTDMEVPSSHGSIPIRVYRPSSQATLPIMVYFHGGGWAFGSIASHDAVCRSYSVALNAVIVSVEYRLAPENPFPAGLEDCCTAVSWVRDHAGELRGDLSTLAVGGDSAGGNLATVVALRARDDPAAPKILFQLLVCPVADYHTPGAPSYAEDLSHPTRAMMEEFFQMYVPNEADSSNPHVCPLNTADLSGLPPAAILTAQYDVLRDEGEAYAARLQSAGVEVTARRFAVPHVAMLSAIVSKPNYELGLALVKAAWQHAIKSAADESPAKL